MDEPWIKDNVVHPVCAFLNSIDCSKGANSTAKTPCKIKDAGVTFETYFQLMHNSLCGDNIENLMGKEYSYLKIKKVLCIFYTYPVSPCQHMLLHWLAYKNELILSSVKMKTV
jgi:hypothetical protein